VYQHVPSYPHTSVASSQPASGFVSAADCSGDHTVKLTTSSGRFVACLQGHSRTPWVVSASCCLLHVYLLCLHRSKRPRPPKCALHLPSPSFTPQHTPTHLAAPLPQVKFHPRVEGVLASGSLDCCVIVWDCSSGRQITSRNFGGGRRCWALPGHCLPGWHQAG
jgi:WD40 repeat protein